MIKTIDKATHVQFIRKFGEKWPSNLTSNGLSKLCGRQEKEWRAVEFTTNAIEGDTMNVYFCEPEPPNFTQEMIIDYHYLDDKGHMQVNSLNLEQVRYVLGHFHALIDKLITTLSK